MATTALCTSFKSELMQAGHCFNATVTVTGSAASGATAVTSVSSMTGVAVGMAVSGTSIAAGSVVASVDSTSSFTLSKATTGTITGGSLTITGDVFKIALVKPSPAGTYDATFQNVGTPGSGTPTTSNLGTDETSGTNYVSGGTALTNVTATTSGSTAFTTFATNPSWAVATFSTIAGIIYNTAARLNGTSGRAVSVHDFGGTQTVSSGTLTLVLPVANSSTALVRLA